MIATSELGRAAALMLVLSSPTLLFSGDEARTIRNSETYRRVFDEFYRRLDNLPGDVLVDELGEQVESAIMKGAHIAQADLKSRVTKVEETVFATLQRRLCPAKEGWPRDIVELSGIESLHAQFSGYGVDHGDYARIVSVLARIVERARGRFCGASGFRALEQ